MDEKIIEQDTGLPEGIPGTAQIRKITSYMDKMELLQLAAKLAESGYEKKLWSVLSRVYSEKKGFQGVYEDGIEEPLERILSSDMPAELKLQTFTSFALPQKVKPSEDVIKELLHGCAVKRINIAAYFLISYDCGAAHYQQILHNKALFHVYVRNAKPTQIIDFYQAIIRQEKKETITQSIRQFQHTKRHLKYQSQDEAKVKEFSELIFQSKEVFFTTKLLACLSFDIPENFLPKGKEMYDILKISINYEERITKEFVDHYHIRFDCSDLAMCRYYLGNKKTTREKALVTKFAARLVKVRDEVEQKKLLHAAFKRG
ncbi:MAG: hypothetical protein K2K20_00920 [Lachnospiraceae bacterium]|nr:hypothetical protein [Lachnospiraceae bacterium]